MPLTSPELLELVTNYGWAGMSPDAAMRLATVNTCVRVLSESVGLVPCVLYRRKKNGGREQAIDHHLYDLLRHKPNGWQTAYDFWEQQTRAVLLRGNGFALKTKYKNETRELIPQNPAECLVEQLDNYALKYTLQKGIQKTQDDVLHLMDATDDGFTGISRIRQAARPLAIATRAEEWGNKVFKDHGIQPGYLQTDQDLKEDQRKQIRDYWRGLTPKDEPQKIPVLTGGMKYETININLEDAQFLEVRKFQREDICGIFRVPPHIAQLYEKTTSWGTGIEQVTLQFVVFTLMPILRRFESKAEVSLLSAKERQEFKIRFNVNTLLRGDMKARSEFYYKMMLMGAMSINEVRRLENLNPIEGGDEHRVPTNTEKLLAELEKESNEQANNETT